MVVQLVLVSEALFAQIALLVLVVYFVDVFLDCSRRGVSLEAVLTGQWMLAGMHDLNVRQKLVTRHEHGAALVTRQRTDVTLGAITLGHFTTRFAPLL